MCRPKLKGRVFAPFWCENGYRFCPFWSGIGYGLRRNYGCVSMCSSFQFQMYTNSSLDKKERVTCELEMAFKKSFVAVLISGMMTYFLFYVDSGVASCDHLQV